MEPRNTPFPVQILFIWLEKKKNIPKDWIYECLMGLFYKSLMSLQYLNIYVERIQKLNKKWHFFFVLWGYQPLAIHEISQCLKNDRSYALEKDSVTKV